MRLLAAMTVLATGLLLQGCMTADRRTPRDRDDRRPPSVTKNTKDPKDDSPWWLEGNSSKSKSKLNDTIAKTDRETIIAGEVVEGVDRKRLKGRTYIVVKPAEETVGATSGRKGDIGVETDDDGYFFMSGLVAGKTYILSAVREVDGKKYAAEAMIKPPAGNVRLELNDNKVSSIMPPPPASFGMGPFDAPFPNPAPSTSVRTPPPVTGERGWEPGSVPPVNGPNTSPNRAVVTPRPENIAGVNPNLPPTANIQPAPKPSTPPVQDGPQSRLPVNRVQNFSLTDTSGSDWEFRYARDRLVLLDFWSTTCQPCMRAVPAIKKLQSNYGASGLEVVAIACEADAPFNQRARQVDEVSRRKEVNYKVYLERDRHVGEVQRLFNVQWVPTLVLLDRQGNILWRGGATDTDLDRVDQIIKTYLTNRN